MVGHKICFLRDVQWWVTKYVFFFRNIANYPRYPFLSGALVLIHLLKVSFGRQNPLSYNQISTVLADCDENVAVFTLLYAVELQWLEQLRGY